MTINMDLTQLHKMQMMADRTQKDANFQAAEDVGRRADLGYFDVEFTMYGCAYLNPVDGKMYYKVSSKAEDIYSFIETAAQKKIYAGNVHKMTQKAPVPSGMRHLIAQDVKRDLARELQKIYPKGFFEYLYGLADEYRNDSAAEQLWSEAEQLEGIFEEERLSQFENLVHYAYSCCKITEATYQSFLEWVEKERRNMDDNFVSKSIHEKTLYGVAYLDNGRYKYLENAQAEYIYEKIYAKEMEGVFVTPMYSKTFWYNNYSYRLADVKKDFSALLKQELDEAYCSKIQMLRSRSTILEEAYEEILRKVAAEWNEDCVNTVKRYACRWRIKLNSWK